MEANKASGASSQRPQRRSQGATKSEEVSAPASNASKPKKSKGKNKRRSSKKEESENVQPVLEIADSAAAESVSQLGELVEIKCVDADKQDEALTKSPVTPEAAVDEVAVLCETEEAGAVGNTECSSQLESSDQQGPSNAVADAIGKDSTAPVILNEPEVSSKDVHGEPQDHPVGSKIPVLLESISMVFSDDGDVMVLPIIEVPKQTETEGDLKISKRDVSGDNSHNSDGPSKICPSIETAIVPSKDSVINYVEVTDCKIVTDVEIQEGLPEVKIDNADKQDNGVNKSLVNLEAAVDKVVVLCETEEAGAVGNTECSSQLKSSDQLGLSCAVSDAIGKDSTAPVILNKPNSKSRSKNKVSSKNAHGKPKGHPVGLKKPVLTETVYMVFSDDRESMVIDGNMTVLPDIDVPKQTETVPKRDVSTPLEHGVVRILKRDADSVKTVQVPDLPFKMCPLIVSTSDTALVPTSSKDSVPHVEDGADSKTNNDIQQGLPAKDDIEQGLRAKDDIEQGLSAKDDIEQGLSAKDDIEQGLPAKDEIQQGLPAKDDIQQGLPAKDDNKDVEKHVSTPRPEGKRSRQEFYEMPHAAPEGTTWESLLPETKRGAELPEENLKAIAWYLKNRFNPRYKAGSVHFDIEMCLNALSCYDGMSAAARNFFSRWTQRVYAMLTEDLATADRMTAYHDWLSGAVPLGRSDSRPGAGGRPNRNNGYPPHRNSHCGGNQNRSLNVPGHLGTFGGYSGNVFPGYSGQLYGYTMPDGCSPLPMPGQMPMQGPMPMQGQVPMQGQLPMHGMSQMQSPGAMHGGPPMPGQMTMLGNSPGYHLPRVSPSNRNYPGKSNRAKEKSNKAAQKTAGNAGPMHKSGDKEVHKSHGPNREAANAKSDASAGESASNVDKVSIMAAGDVKTGGLGEGDASANTKSDGSTVSLVNVDSNVSANVDKVRTGIAEVNVKTGGEGDANANTKSDGSTVSFVNVDSIVSANVDKVRTGIAEANVKTGGEGDTNAGTKSDGSTVSLVNVDSNVSANVDKVSTGIIAEANVKTGGEVDANARTKSDGSTVSFVNVDANVSANVDKVRTGTIAEANVKTGGEGDANAGSKSDGFTVSFVNVDSIVSANVDKVSTGTIAEANVKTGGEGDANAGSKSDGSTVSFVNVDSNVSANVDKVSTGIIAEANVKTGGEGDANAGTKSDGSTVPIIKE